MSKSNYGIEDIEHLNTHDAMRARIQMYLGSDDDDGIYQAFKEIVNNSTDEALAGYGDTIHISVAEDWNIISIADEGRGVPFGMKDGRNVLVAIYTESHTGGKFNNDVYKNASGLNGIGGTAVCMSSEKFAVTSVRGDMVAHAEFEKGILKNYSEMSRKEWEAEYGEKPKKSGTVVTFKPDKEVFKNMEKGFSYEKICEEIKNIAYLNKGVHFIIDDSQGHSVEYYSKNGIADFIKDKVKHPIMRQPIIASMKDTTDELEIAFMWSADPSQSYVFVNGLYCPEGGTPLTGAKTSITQQVKRLSKKEFDPDLIRKGLVFAINCKVQEPSFANQTKSKINNPNLRTLASQAFREGLEKLALTSDFDIIVNILEKSQKAENAANRARQAVLESDKEKTAMRSKKALVLDKISDARILGLNSHLLICEGKSARGSAEKGRDKDYHGIFEARGKMINPLTAQEEKYFNNEEIKLLQVAIGVDYGRPLDLKKLRYGFVDFFVDPDVDGAHIFLLGLLNLWKICPEYVKQGRIGWYHAPLFIVENRGKNTYFYTDEDYNMNGRTLKGEVRRVKGIGLLEKHELQEAIFQSEKAHEVFKYTPEAMEALEALMGADVQPKKDYVFSHIDFSEYGEM